MAHDLSNDLHQVRFFSVIKGTDCLIFEITLFLFEDCADV